MLRRIFWPICLIVVAVPACGSDAPAYEKSDFVLEAKVDQTPPIVGRNTMTLTVKDLTGNPVTGATLVVDPEMPSHGHGSPEIPVIQDLGGGQYKADPVSLIMVGRWEINVTATQGALRGKKMFPVDVP